MSIILRSRFGRCLAAHRWLVLVLAVAAALRVAVAIAYRPALFFNDSWDYLAMAYKAFPVGYSFARPSGYPLVIKALSLAGHHLMVITTAQHLAGLAVGLLVYLLLTRAQVPRWLAAAATALVTLDLYAITLEQTILAEAFFTLALLGAVYLAIRAPPTYLALSASGALLAAATLMRVAGLFAFPAWFLYLAWKRVGLRPLVVGGLAFAIPVLVYAGVQQHVTGKFGLVEANGWFLYGRIAEIASPCGDAKIPAATRSLCERRPHSYPNAPGFYTWSSASPAWKLFGGPAHGDRAERRRSNQLLHRFAVAIIRDRPLKYGKLVLGDFGRYFEPGVRSESHPEDLPTTRVAELGPMQRGVLARYLPGYVPRSHYSASFLSRLERWLHTPRWLLAVFAICGLAAPAGAVIRRRPESPGHTSEATLLVASGLLILLGSSANSGFVLRYAIPEVPLFVCGGVLAIWQLTSARLPSSPKEPA